MRAEPAHRPSLRGEILRIALLVAAAFLVLSPYLTSRQVGGVDARWYAAMLTDYLHQLRSGHFLVLNGETRFNWTGGVHPYRTGPLFMNLAGLWDCLTLGRLEPLLLQHLTVLTSGIIGTVGAYLAFALVLPQVRWGAWCLALIYLFSPAWLGLIAGNEAYMSYMVFAVLPLVLYGNARAILVGDAGGYVALAVGLALAWMGHVPIANICLLASLALQVGLLVGARKFPVRPALVCVGWFLLLDAYFFATLSDLPPWHEHPAPDVVRALAFCAFFAGFAKGGLARQGWPWLVVAAGGLAVGGGMTPPWFVWLGLAAALALGGQFVLRRTGRVDPDAFDLLFFSLLAAAFVADRLVGHDHWGRNTIALDHFVDSAREWPAMVRPFGWDLFPRPGCAVVVLLTAAILLRWFARGLAGRLFSAVVIGILIFTERIPGVSDFIVGYFPRYLASMSTMTLTLRLVPPLVGFALMAAATTLAPLAAGPAWRRRTIVAVLAILAAGSAAQATVFFTSNRSLTGTREQTEASMRTENLPTFRYDYDYVYIPRYLGDGVSDPALECRLLDASGRILSDSREAAAACEREGAREISLVIGPDQPAWAQFAPVITVRPGEQLLVRFQFDPAKAYAGWFFLNGAHAYREYHLPVSGFPRSFGSTEGSSRVIKLWNSSAESETYHLSYNQAPDGTVGRGERFATLVVSQCNPDRLAVDLKSLTPFTAVVRAPADCVLETCRAFLPGYEATVDGRPVAVSRSAEGQVALPVPAGAHTVVLTVHPTVRDRIALVVSAGAWAALGWLGLRRRRA